MMIGWMTKQTAWSFLSGFANLVTWKLTLIFCCWALAPADAAAASVLPLVAVICVLSRLAYGFV